MIAGRKKKKKKDKLVGKPIALYPREWEKLEEIAGLESVTHYVRQIIRKHMATFSL